MVENIYPFSQPLDIVIINNKHATKGDFQKRKKKEIGT